MCGSPGAGKPWPQEAACTGLGERRRGVAAEPLSASSLLILYSLLKLTPAGTRTARERLGDPVVDQAPARTRTRTRGRRAVSLAHTLPQTVEEGAGECSARRPGPAEQVGAGYSGVPQGEST